MGNAAMWMSEPVSIPDVFVSELALIEDLGDGNIRFTYSTKQKPPHDSAANDDHVIVARLVLSLPAVLTARERMTQLFGCYCGASRTRLRQ